MDFKRRKQADGLEVTIRDSRESMGEHWEDEHGQIQSAQLIRQSHSMIGNQHTSRVIQNNNVNNEH